MILLLEILPGAMPDGPGDPETTILLTKIGDLYTSIASDIDALSVSEPRAQDYVFVGNNVSRCSYVQSIQ